MTSKIMSALFLFGDGKNINVRVRLLAMVKLSKTNLALGQSSIFLAAQESRKIQILRQHNHTHKIALKYIEKDKEIMLG